MHAIDCIVLYIIMDFHPIIHSLLFMYSDIFVFIYVFHEKNNVFKILSTVNSCQEKVFKDNRLRITINFFVTYINKSSSSLRTLL